MAKNMRVFVSFAVEDSNLRDFLIGQARNEKSPFSFVDMSVKRPWDSSWKTNCRTKIKGCDGVIGLVTKYTAKADGQLWELGCAFDENIPTLLIYGNTTDRPTNLPAPISGKRILNWTWPNITTFINGL
jgi:nucleoside 2-deoxyribosyltransferase